MDVPPKIVIEIDIDDDVEQMTESGYIYKKTQMMLAFGTQKVLAVTLKRQTVQKNMTNERKKNYICQIMSRQNYVNNLW